MKRLLLLLMPTLIAFVACKKKDIPEPISGDGFWSLGLDTIHPAYPGGYIVDWKKTTFNINKVARQTINGEFVLLGTDATRLDSLQVYFATEPKYSKKYASVSFHGAFDVYDTRLNTNQIGIRSRVNIPLGNYNYSEFFGSPNENNYFGIRADSIAVSVNNGKITVNIPRLLTNGFIANQDSAMIQGVLVEK
jgi:hypothetical protein